jgi:hypothetical protein
VPEEGLLEGSKRRSTGWAPSPPPLAVLPLASLSPLAQATGEASAGGTRHVLYDRDEKLS